MCCRHLLVGRVKRERGKENFREWSETRGQKGGGTLPIKARVKKWVERDAESFQKSRGVRPGGPVSDASRR